jgi:NhaP-type Na+/H+ or K+/H+ antiporter
MLCPAITGNNSLAGVVAILLVLTARLVNVSIPISILKLPRSFSRHVVKILTWSGPRGAFT